MKSTRLEHWAAWFAKRASDEEIKAAKLTQAWAKTFFDFVKNLVLLGALKYYADKTSNVYLITAYYICSGFLVLFCFAYWHMWRIHFFRSISDNRLARLCDEVFRYSIGVMFLFAINLAINDVVSELTKLQSK